MTRLAERNFRPLPDCCCPALQLARARLHLAFASFRHPPGNDTEIKDSDLAIAVCAACTVTALGRHAYGPEQRVLRVHRRGRSEVNFFLYDSIEFTGKSSLEGGLRIDYNWNQGDYGVAAFGRNLTDQTRITGFINEPCTVGVEFSARF